MADIKNYTLNFGSGRTHGVLNFANAKLASLKFNAAR